MPTGTITRSTERVFLGGYTMRIEAVGVDLWSGWSNAIDISRFSGALMLSCWISGEAFSGTSSLKAEVHFFNASGTDLGSEVVWADHGDTAEAFTQFIAQVKRLDLPAGTAHVRLRFGITDGNGTGLGIGYVDAVQAVPGEWVPAWTPSILTELSTLDDVSDGTVHGRVKVGNLLSGDINLASASIKNRGALAVLDVVTDKEIANNAVTKDGIQDSAVTNVKIATGAVGSTHIATGAVGATQLATGAVTSTKIGSSAVGATQLASSAASLTKVSGGILTGSGNVATLPSGKTFNGVAGIVKLKTFSAMPTMGQVEDGEWFAVTSGAAKGIYVRTGSVAMNGVGDTQDFSL
jgi:hypothetical protein